MVTSAELLADVGERETAFRVTYWRLGERQQAAATATADDLLDLEAEHLGGHFDDALGGDRLLQVVGDEVAEDERGEVDGERLLRQLA